MVRSAGMEELIRVDSAGTHDYHIGHPPDRRAQVAAAQRGYDLSGLRARRICDRDFIEFDYILAMDVGNLAELRRIGPGEHNHKPRLLMEYSATHRGEEIPDPYYGRVQGFELVLDMIEDAARGLLRHMKEKPGI